MKKWLRTCALALAFVASVAQAEDLLQIYREAQKQDPAIAAARSQWEATQERVPQARAGLLPQVSAQGQANANYYDAQFNTNPKSTVSQNYGFGSLVFSASQPLYRPQNVVFEAPVPVGEDQLIQPVRMTDAEGRAWLAVYPMQRGADGVWRTNGCQIRRFGSAT